MSDIMITYAHDFATRWEMEAYVRKDLEAFDAIKDHLIELGMTGAKHGVMFGQKDKHRTIAVLTFKDVESYKKCVEIIEGHDWYDEITKVMRHESYVIDAEVVL